MKTTRANLNKIIANFLLEYSAPELSLVQKIIDAEIVKPNEKILYISGKEQMFYLFNKGELVKKGKVSTGAKGFGNETDSGKTATGLMSVAGIVGNGLERGTVLRGLAPTNPRITLGDHEKGPKKGHAAEVLTRAITLRGLEDKNKNVNSRSIYIHGTNREKYLGRAASGGCIRVSNDDIIELAESLMSRGDKIYIDPLGDLAYDPPVATKEESYADKLYDYLGLDEIKIDDEVASSEDAIEILKDYPPSKNA